MADVQTKDQKHVVIEEIKNSQQRLLENMNEGKIHLKKETCEVKKISRLKKNVEEQKLQLEKENNKYKTQLKKTKISEYEELHVEVEDLLNDFEHYTNMMKVRQERVEWKS